MEKQSRACMKIEERERINQELMPRKYVSFITFNVDTLAQISDQS